MSPFLPLLIKIRHSFRFNQLINVNNYKKNNINIHFPLLVLPVKIDITNDHVVSI